jgi:hypothetical protein
MITGLARLTFGRNDMRRTADDLSTAEVLLFDTYFSWLPSGPLSFPERGPLGRRCLGRGSALSMCHQTAPTECQ